MVCTRGPQDEGVLWRTVTRVDLPALFPGHDLSSVPRSILVGNAWKKAVKNARVTDRDTLPLFVVTPQVAERVPAADLATRRQRLTYTELAFVLRTVVLKVVDATEDGEPGAVLARDYFLGDGYRRRFRRYAGRRLNADKLAALTAVLVRHGFVAKENWRTRGRGSSRFDATRYRLGPRPPLLPGVFMARAGLR